MNKLTINFLGDSITEGCGAPTPETKFSTVLCRLIDANEGNYGLGGSRIARQRVASDSWNPDENFQARARWMNPCDFLFVFGGTNDFGHGDAPLGEFGDDTPWTFYGAVKCLCDYLLEAKKIEKSRICFILPTPRQDQESQNGDGSKGFRKWPTLKEYRKALVEVVSSYGLDMFDPSLPAPPLGIAGPSQYYVDGLHPNEKGHRYLAEELYAYLKKKGIVE